MLKREEGLWMAVQALRLEYARRLALYEIKLYGNNDNEGRDVKDNEEAKIRDYSMSSALRRHFMMRMIVVRMNGAYEQAGVTKEQLGCSRAALDTMITECKEANWLSVRKNKQGYRSIQATEVVVQCWLGYADYVTRIATEVDLNYLSYSARKIRDLLTTK